MQTKQNEPGQASHDYLLIEKALLYLEENFLEQPDLNEVAAVSGLSDFHFQKLFQRWVGISPKRFLQFLTKEYAKQVLSESKNMLDATFDSGLSSPGRLHDLMIQCEAVTPGELKSGGEGLTIRYGVQTSPFGACLIGVTDRGVCRFEFLGGSDNAGYEERFREFKKDWPRARFLEDAGAASAVMSKVFPERFSQKGRVAIPLNVLLKGTNFQIKVWEALVKIPSGMVLSYEDLAGRLGNRDATRAVASAVARNRIGFIIPCHRVIRKMGVAHQYYYGRIRKKAILAWEAGQRFGNG